MGACANELMKRFPPYGWMVFCILLINFLVWIKVSTDIFVVMAIFLCLREPGKGEINESLQ